jgi:hypothetical protein
MLSVDHQTILVLALSMAYVLLQVIGSCTYISCVQKNEELGCCLLQAAEPSSAGLQVA